MYYTVNASRDTEMSRASSYTQWGNAKTAVSLLRKTSH